MHTVEMLEQALETAERLGYKIRQEYLGGSGGSACEFGGQKWLFVDLALNQIEQLDQVTEALKGDPAIHVIDIPESVQKLLDLPEAA